jgi:hypothetical protein
MGLEWMLSMAMRKDSLPLYGFAVVISGLCFFLFVKRVAVVRNAFR